MIAVFILEPISPLNESFLFSIAG